MNRVTALQVSLNQNLPPIFFKTFMEKFSQINAYTCIKKPILNDSLPGSTSIVTICKNLNNISDMPQIDFHEPML